jgi:pyruvate,water dikinase
MTTARAHDRAAGRRRMIVLSLSALEAGMLDTVGGKAANLGELIGAGFAVPDGFVVTTDAYRVVAAPVDDLIGRCDGPELAVRARAVSLAAELPADVAAAVRDGYLALGEDVAVAVRSSATAEDLPYASFAGQQDTYFRDDERCVALPSADSRSASTTPSTRRWPRW